MIEIEVEDDSAHQEKSQEDPKHAAVTPKGIETQQAQEQGQEEVAVVASGGEAVGEAPAGAYQEPVEGRDASDELAVLRGAKALAVVVAARKVPHQVTQVHVVELVGGIVFDIAPEIGVAARPGSGIDVVVLVLAPHAGVEGGVLVAFAGHICLEARGRRGFALVDGRPGVGADGDDEVGREADEEEGKKQKVKTKRRTITFNL